MEFQESLRVDSVGIPPKPRAHAMETTNLRFADFPYTYRGTEKLLVLHRNGNSKIRVLSNLFNIPSNRYGFHRQTSA